MTGSHNGAEPTAGHARLRNVVGRSTAFHEIERQIDRIAGLIAPVLIEGETGCGKAPPARNIEGAVPHVRPIVDGSRASSGRAA